MTQRPKAVINRHSKWAADLIKHYFGKRKAKATPLTGGFTNSVFLVKSTNEELVVRISEEPEKINFFLKEQWAVAQAKKKNIPVPEILEVGNTVIPAPYMISRKVEGEEASNHLKRTDIVRKMGEIASIIHSIPTQDYGNAFDWSQNTLSKNPTWRRYLEVELRVNERLESLKRHKMITVKTQREIKKILGGMMKWKDAPCLHHGDLRLKNVMVDKEGNIMSLIDWENCISSIPPYWDVSIALHDLAIDKQGEFLEGYKLNGSHLIKIAPFLKVLNILNYAPEIDRFVMEKDKARLDHYKARMHGALDMFTL